MFVGHYAPALVLTRLAPRLPLWAALLGVELMDVGWSALVFVGIERASLDPTLPGNPLVLESMPWTHSLLATAAMSGAAGAVAASRWGREAGLALAVAVTSHWVLDLLVHRPDLTLAGAPPRLGLGLWNWPGIEFAVEVGGLVAAAAVARGPVDARGLVAVLLALQVAVTFGPPPPAVGPMAIGGLAVYLSAPAWAAWAERRAA